MKIINRNKLAISRVKEMLSYDKDTGVFTWIKVNKNHSQLNFIQAGTVRRCRGKAYRWISIDGCKYAEHRLAWFYCHNKWPVIIDHKNGNGLDNRIENLNNVNITMNAQNHKSRIKANGLPTGVKRTQYGRFEARITINKTVRHLGVYGTKEEALMAYKKERLESHYCPRGVSI